MSSKVALGMFAVAGLLVLGSTNSFAEYAGGAPGTGSISGVVTFKGTIPPPIMQNLKNEKNPEFCTKHPDTNKDGVRPIYKVEAKDGKLKNAVVFIENIDKGKDWAKAPVHVDFKECDIFPRMTIARKASKEGAMVIENQDTDILHNPHGYNVKGASRTTLFNKPLPSKGSSADVSSTFARFKEGKDFHFFLQCDQHNFMEADGRIVANPYFAVTGADGAFKIDGIPAGSYKVTVWQPYAKDPVTKDVTVAAGDVKSDFELAGK